MVPGCPGIATPGDHLPRGRRGDCSGLRWGWSTGPHWLGGNSSGEAQKRGVGYLLDGRQPLRPACWAREGLSGEAGWEGWGPEHLVPGYTQFGGRDTQWGRGAVCRALVGPLGQEMTGCRKTTGRHGLTYPECLWSQCCAKFWNLACQDGRGCKAA